MGELLVDANLDNEVNDEARFDKLYKTYHSTWLSDYAWDEEEILKASELFDLYTNKTSLLQKSAHMFSGFDASGGMIEYFKNTEKVSKDPAVVKAFLKFAGSWVDVAMAPKDTYTFRGKWNQKRIAAIVEIIMKVFFEYEKDRLVFPRVEASLKQFSFVNFKKTLSRKINAWLETDPEIEGLYSLTKTQATIPLKYAFTNVQTNAHFNVPEELKNITSYKNGFPQYQRVQLENLGFLLRKVNYISYAPGQENSIRLEDDLEEVSGTRTIGTFFLNLKSVEYQNGVRRAYTSFFLSLLRQHAEIIRLGSAENMSSLSRLEEKFESDSDDAVNEKNENKLSSDDGATKGAVGYRIAQSILNNLRAQALLEIIKKFKEDPRNDLSDDETAKIFKKAEQTTKNNEEIAGKNIETEDLSDEDIKLKQKFLKQCLLMSRLKDISKMNIDAMKSKIGIHEKIPYKGRLYYVRDQKQDSCSVINKLLIPNIKSIEAFKNITPAEHASLVPKIRLVKIFTEDGKLKEHEFKFPKKTDTNRVNNLFSTDFDKGSDFGVKEFSFSFDGTTPATAKNDITANLKLYFQSFDDFIKKHPENNGHRYVDLLILPSKDNVNKKGSGTASPLQFDTSYYRIRVDVGWESSSAPNETIRKAIQKINKTFYLNMVDHEINIRDDGSVDINVSYRAYIESTLKGTTLDALASRESRQALEKIRKEYRDVVNTAACTNKQLSTIRSQFLQIEENLRRNAFQSIIKRLVENDLMKHVVAEGSAANSFATTGFLSSAAIFTSDKPKNNGTSELADKSNPKNFTLQQNLFRDVTLSNSKDNLLINYFYLGDLLYVILDCLYVSEINSKNINETYVKDTENFKFILSSFDFIDIFNNSSTETVNIGNIPISVELFNEWFTENIVKPERNSYPVMYFIRDITKFLIGEILLETCFKNDLDKRLQFKTSNFLGKKIAKFKTDPIGELLLQSDNAVLDVNTYYRKGDLPLQADINGVSTPMKDLFNYIMIYVDAARIKTDKVGNKFDDENNGVMHYQLGKDRGILKKIKFTKSDMQYIREARFFRHGHDGLMQLSAVYKISMDMVGNTLYYPGMEVFIDPVGLIGAGSDFDPRLRQSIANKLGFGGYHLVTRVKSTIGPGKFTTNVEALFDYSGDGDPKSRVIGSKEEIKISAIDDDKISDRPQGVTSQKYCQAVSDDLNKRNIELGYGFNQEYSGLDAKTQDLASDAYVETLIQEVIGGGETELEANEIVQPDPLYSPVYPEPGDTEITPGREWQDSEGRIYQLDDQGNKAYMDEE